MRNFDIMINEEKHTLITIKAENVELAKEQALLKYLNKDVSQDDTTFGVSVQVVKSNK